MTSSRLCSALVASGLAALTACGTTTASTGERNGAPDESRPGRDQGTTLVIGSVSDDAKEEAEVFQPFVDHVARSLAAEGVTDGNVVVTETVEEMAKRLRTGEVDLYIDSMYGIAAAMQDGASVPVLRRWKDGSATYRSIVVTRRDSGITSSEDLRGRTMAFEDPTSTDGYILPAATLVERGMTIFPVDKPGMAVPADDIGYVFSDDDENTVFQVLDGQVDAGALSNEDLLDNVGPRADELMTVMRTIDVPRHAVVVREDLDPSLQRALVAELVDLHTSPQGRRVMEAFDETARFDG